eukprot:11586655-Alexandrium_andersonii.AAC.1
MLAEGRPRAGHAWAARRPRMDSCQTTARLPPDNRQTASRPPTTHDLGNGGRVGRGLGREQRRWKGTK